MKNVLLTGANGLLGQKLVYALKSRNDIELLATGIGQNRLIDQANYSFQSLDITNKTDLVTPTWTIRQIFNEGGVNKSKFSKDFYLGDLETDSDYIIIKCRDHEYVDGDKIRLMLNGSVIHPNITLSSSNNPQSSVWGESKDSTGLINFADAVFPGTMKLTNSADGSDMGTYIVTGTTWNVNNNPDAGYVEAVAFSKTEYEGE